MLQLSDVFGSEREGIPKMLENTDRTIGPKFSHLDANLLQILKKGLTCSACCWRREGPRQPGRRTRSWCRSRGSWRWSGNESVIESYFSACFYFTDESNVVQRISLYCINSMAMSPQLCKGRYYTFARNFFNRFLPKRFFLKLRTISYFGWKWDTTGGTGWPLSSS